MGCSFSVSSCWERSGCFSAGENRSVPTSNEIKKTIISVQLFLLQDLIKKGKVCEKNLEVDRKKYCFYISAANIMQDTISQSSPNLARLSAHFFFLLIVLFSALYETINTAAIAGTDSAVTFGENIAVLSLVSSIKRWRQ